MNKAALNRWLARTGWSSIVGGVLAAGLGWLLFSLEATRDFQRFSYDWPFAWSKQPVPTEVVIVGLDETSYKALGQRFHEPWDRALHAQLLRRLKDAGARVVAFDIVFSDPNPNRPEADRALADAIREHGRVVLGGEAVLTADNRGLLNEQLFPPFDLLATNAAAWGDIALPEDPDRVIRRHLPTATEPHSLAWTAAELAGAPATQRSEDANAVRWINYYGPPGTIPKISYQQALDPRAVPPNYFKDKIVFVGQQLATGSGGDLKDTFGTAFTRAGHGPSDGVEIQATICLNLLRGDWLTRLPAWLEITLLTLLGAGLGAGLGRLRHWPAILTALGAALGATLLAWLLFRYQLHWLAWAILVTQAVMALAWYLFCASLRLYVEKQVLKESLEVHLSPARAEQLLANRDLLKPGGKTQQVSILFSDIANFARHAERLDPDDLFRLLNNYYGEALKCFHDTDGTIVQIIGDAIYAIWNAPLDQAGHQERAVRTALALHQKLVSFNEGKSPIPLRTRVGIHTGEATVGNLGSEKRFDFACIGTNVNLTSRLEGLNKHLGTDLLATRAIQRHVEEEVVSRRLGFFRLKGFGRAVEIYELLGEGAEFASQTRAWRDTFEDGLQHYLRKRFNAAEQAFRETIRLRAQVEAHLEREEDELREDGPSLFYLAVIARLKYTDLPESWDGEVNMEEK